MSRSPWLAIRSTRFRRLVPLMSESETSLRMVLAFFRASSAAASLASDAGVVHDNRFRRFDAHGRFQIQQGCGS